MKNWHQVCANADEVEIRRWAIALQSVADLEQAIARYIREHNAASGPFVWTKSYAGIWVTA